MGYIQNSEATLKSSQVLYKYDYSSDVFVPRTKTKMGDRTFEVAGPSTWNSLPATIRETKTLPALKNS